MTILTELKVLLTGDISQFQQSMSTAANTVSSVGANMTSAGKSLTTGVTLPLLGAAAGAVTFANEFNSGMANVASLGTEAAAAVSGWTPMVQQMAIATGKSTGDMTAGLYNVVSAFGVADDTLVVLDVNARAAAAGLSTTTDAINLTSAVTKGYGDTSAEAVTHAADLALMTVQLGQTTFPELAASIGSVVPLAASLGVTQEELFGIMATGTGVTGNASAVSTQLRGVLQSLMAPTTGMTALMADLGYENGQAMLAGLGMQGAIEAIVGAAESSGEPLQGYIGSIEGQTLAMALAGPQADVLSDKLAAMGTAAGALDTAFAAQTTGVNAAGFQWEQLKTQMQVTATNVGQQLLPAFTSLMTFLTPVILYVGQLAERFAALSPNQQLVIAGILALVVAIGPVLVVLGTLISSVGTVMGAVSAFSGVIATAGAALGIVTVPMWAVIAVVAAVGAAIYLLYTAWTNNWGGIQEATATILAAIQGVITSALAGVQALWDTHGAAVMRIVTALWEIVGTIAEVTITRLVTSVRGWLFVLQSFWTKHGAAVEQVVSVLWTVLNVIITSALAVIEGVVKAVLAAVRGDWAGFGAALKGIVTGIWAAINTKFSDGVGSLGDIVTNGIAAIKGFFTDTDWGAVGNAIVTGIAAGLSAGAGAIANAASAAAQAALDAAKSLLGINSPSKVFEMEVGLQSGAGIALGFDKSRQMVAKSVMGLVAPLPALASSALSNGGGGAGNVNNSRQFTYVNNGAAPRDPQNWFAQQERLAAVLGV